MIRTSPPFSDEKADNFQSDFSFTKLNKRLIKQTIQQNKKNNKEPKKSDNSIEMMRSLITYFIAIFAMADGKYYMPEMSTHMSAGHSLLLLNSYSTHRT